jgi:hypothetical protein
MSTARSPRDLEYDYLSLAYQIEDLLKRKAAAYGVDVEIAATHRRMANLAKEILESADPRNYEQEYLSAAHKIQELLQQKSKVYAMALEFQELQRQMEEVGSQLGWSDRPETAQEAPMTDHLNRLQSEIQELSATLS